MCYLYLITFLTRLSKFVVLALKNISKIFGRIFYKIRIIPKLLNIKNRWSFGLYNSIVIIAS